MSDNDERPGYVKAGGYWVSIEPLSLPTCCGAPNSTVCHQYGLCRMNGVHPTVAKPSSDAEALRRVIALADEFDAQVPWPHSWIGNRIREAAGVEK